MNIHEQELAVLNILLILLEILRTKLRTRTSIFDDLR
jgi:hypothetical protein